MIRKIVQIDEARCDGCGLCIPSCAEGAIALVDGKARLSGDALCDGLGACLGECPQGAITVIEREAADFDEAAVKANLAKSGVPAHGGHALPSRPAPLAAVPPAQATRPRLSIVSDPLPRAGRRLSRLAPAHAHAAALQHAAHRGGSAEPARTVAGPAQPRPGDRAVLPGRRPPRRGRLRALRLRRVPRRAARRPCARRGLPEARRQRLLRREAHRHPHPLRHPQRHRRAHGGAVLRRDRDGRAPRGRGVGQVASRCATSWWEWTGRCGKGGGGRAGAAKGTSTRPRPDSTRPVIPSVAPPQAARSRGTPVSGGAKRETTPRSRCTRRRRRASSRRAGPHPTLRPRGPPRAVRRRVLARPRRADRHVAIPSVPRGAARPRGASGDRAGGALDVVGRHVQRLLPSGGDCPP